MTADDKRWAIQAACEFAREQPRISVDPDDAPVDVIDGTYWVRAWVLVTPDDADAARVSAGERQEASDFFWAHSA